MNFCFKEDLYVFLIIKLLLGIHPEKTETLIQKEARTTMLRAALYIKQPRHGSNPSAYQQMTGSCRCDKNTHTQWSATQPFKINEKLPCAATWMDLVLWLVK